MAESAGHPFTNSPTPALRAVADHCQTMYFSDGLDLGVIGGQPKEVHRNHGCWPKTEYLGVSDAKRSRLAGSMV